MLSILIKVFKALYLAHPPPGMLQSAKVLTRPNRRFGGLGGLNLLRKENKLVFFCKIKTFS